MHSATRRLSSRFFIGGPSLSLGRKWSSGKMDALTSLNTRRAESFHPFSKKFEKKKKKTNCKTVRFGVIFRNVSKGLKS